MASVFISYSRKDQAFVRRLFEALKAAGRDAWVDWEDIPPTAQWLQEIFAGIDAADTFIVVLSPDSLSSEMCGKEVAHAIDSRKRVVPVVWREVSVDDVKAVAALAPLTALQWISFRAGEDFAPSFAQLRFALDTDLDYWHLSSRLLVRAKEWGARAKNANLTLRGPDLAEAERWLTAGADKEPRPTAQQIEYISASRRAATARQRRLLTSVSAALVVTLILATISSALYQQTQAQNAQLLVRALAGASSDALTNNRIDQALLLSAEAMRRQPGSSEARDALFNSLEYSPYLDTILQGQPSRADGGRAVAFSADGSILLSATTSGHITLWDVAKHVVRHQFSVATPDCKFYRYATLSPDGRIVATAPSNDCTPGGTDLWDATTGGHLAHLPTASLNTSLNVLAFSPNGQQLVAYDDVGVVGVWNVVSGTRVRDISIGGDGILSWVAISPDGTTAAAGSASAAALWNLTTGAIIHTFGFGAYGGAFSPDGKTLALAYTTGGVKTYDIASGTLASETFDAFASVTSLAYDADGRLLAFNDENSNAVVVWDTVNDAQVGAPLQAHTGTVINVAASRDGQHFASIGDDDRVVLWRFTPSSAHSIPLGNNQAGQSAAALSPDGKELATCNTTTGQVVLWDLQTGRSISAFGNNVTCATIYAGNTLAFNPQGTTLAVGSDGGQITLFDVATGTQAGATLSLPNNLNVMTVLFSRDGRYLAACGQGGDAAVWDVATGTQVFHYGLVNDMAFSPDGTTLALATATSSTSGNAHGAIQLWRTSSQAIVATLPATASSVEGVAYSPDGKTLAAIDSEGTVTFWDVSTGKPDLTPSFTGGTSRTTASYRVTYSPDGRTLVATDGTSIVLWDVAVHQQLVRPVFEPSTFYNVLFSSDGKLLIETQFLGPVIVRYATPDGWAAEACQIANRNLTQAEWKQYVGSEPYHKTCPGLPAGH